MKKVPSYLILVLITFEILARIDPYLTNLIEGSSQITTLFSKDSHGKKGIPYATWKDYKLNKFGFNDDNDYEKENKSGKLRIIFLGNSISFYGNPLAGDTLPEHLENRLNSYYNNRVEIINASVPGQTFNGMVDRYIEDYYQFHPDIILFLADLTSYMNGKHTKVIKVNKPFDQLKIIKKMIDYRPDDSLLTLNIERFHLRESDLIQSVPDISIQRFARDFNRLYQKAIDTNSLVIPSNTPCLLDEDNFHKYRYEQAESLRYHPRLTAKAHTLGVAIFNNSIKELANAHQLPFVDLQSNVEKNKVYFQDIYHLTELGMLALIQAYEATIKSVIEENDTMKQKLYQ